MGPYSHKDSYGNNIYLCLMLCPSPFYSERLPVHQTLIQHRLLQELSVILDGKPYISPGTALSAGPNQLPLPRQSGLDGKATLSKKPSGALQAPGASIRTSRGAQNLVM